MAAQDPRRSHTVERRAAITHEGGITRRHVRRSDRSQHRLDSRARHIAVGHLDKLQLASGAATQQIDRGVGIATADRLGKWPDR